MNSAWLADYVEAWTEHPLAGTSDGHAAFARLTALLSPAIHYEDVPSTSVFTGHDGFAQMCASAHGFSSDLHFEILSRQTDGTRYAFETNTIGTHTGAVGPLPATGRSFVLRGVSVGSVDESGLVVEQRDYWDMGSFLRQVGVLPG